MNPTINMMAVSQTVDYLVTIIKLISIHDVLFTVMYSGEDDSIVYTPVI